MHCLLCNDIIDKTPKLYQLLTFTSGKDYICTSCHSQFQKISANHCLSCYKEGAETKCLDCKMWERKKYHPKHIAIYRYNYFMKEYFSQYKFMGDYYLRKIFQREIKEQLGPFLKQGYTLVPVPLSEQRFDERGFNQVLGLIEPLAYLDIFEKKEIEKQSSKNRQERLEQENPFSLKKLETLPKKIIIVDDIYTTGATLHQLVTLLHEANVDDVMTFSLAR